MKDKKVFTNRGRSWICWPDELSGYWMASSESPSILISAPSWTELKDEMSTIDITQPRQDGIAVVESLGVGSEQGF